MLWFGTGAAGMGSVCVTAEFENFCVGQLKNIFEATTNLHQCVLASGFAGRSRPEADSVESLSYIDDNSHNLVVTLILQSLANRSELSV